MNALKPCGTLAAYHRHLRRREIPCDDCVQANTEAKQKPSIPTPALRKPIKHGTPAGYKQHRYRGEQACQDCLTAENVRRRAYQIEWRKARRRAGAAS